MENCIVYQVKALMIEFPLLAGRGYSIGPSYSPFKSKFKSIGGVSYNSSPWDQCSLGTLGTLGLYY